MISKINELSFAHGAKNLDVTYGENDLESIKKDGAVSLTQVSVFKKDDPKKETFFAAIGVDADGKLMINPQNFAAFPCPPYCKAGQNFIEITKF